MQTTLVHPSKGRDRRRRHRSKPRRRPVLLGHALQRDPARRCVVVRVGPVPAHQILQLILVNGQRRPVCINANACAIALGRDGCPIVPVLKVYRLHPVEVQSDPVQH